MATRTELDRLLAHTSRIRGWLAPEEAETLYDAAKACRGRGVIVEIGSYRGRSTVCLGLGSRAGAGVPVYAISIHEKKHFNRFTHNIESAGVDKLVTPVAGRSQDIAPDFEHPIELLFIDGRHGYEEVREDFEDWAPKLIDGGWLAMHDTTWIQGPRRVADSLVLRSRRFRHARFVPGSLVIAEKVPANTARDRLRSRSVLAVKTAYTAAGTLFKPPRRWLPAGLEARTRAFLARM
jgi:predicted O-methyltransferase YrrM